MNLTELYDTILLARATHMWTLPLNRAAAQTPSSAVREDGLGGVIHDQRVARPELVILEELTGALTPTLEVIVVLAAVKVVDHRGRPLHPRPREPAAVGLGLVGTRVVPWVCGLGRRVCACKEGAERRAV